MQRVRVTRKATARAPRPLPKTQTRNPNPQTLEGADDEEDDEEEEDEEEKEDEEEENGGSTDPRSVSTKATSATSNAYGACREIRVGVQRLEVAGQHAPVKPTLDATNSSSVRHSNRQAHLQGYLAYSGVGLWLGLQGSWQLGCSEQQRPPGAPHTLLVPTGVPRS